MTETVLYQVKDGIALLELNRPEVCNAVNTQLMKDLSGALTRAEEDPEVRVVILTGAGKHFVSGGDLKEFHEQLHTGEDVYQKFSQMRDLLYRIAVFPKPVIAAVNGAARGGGGEIAAACHFRIACHTSTIGFVQVNLGISTGWGGAALLARTIGAQKALRLLLTGKVLSADEAEHLGLFDEVAPVDQFWDAVWRLARDMAAHPPAAVQGILQMMRQSYELRLEEAMDLETRLCASLWNTEAHREAVESFLKRKN